VTGNLLALSPTTLPDTPPLEYVAAAAGYGGRAASQSLAAVPVPSGGG